MYKYVNMNIYIYILKHCDVNYVSGADIVGDRKLRLRLHRLRRLECRNGMEIHGNCLVFDPYLARKMW